jgi:hypothetical protein
MCATLVCKGPVAEIFTHQMTTQLIGKETRPNQIFFQSKQRTPRQTHLSCDAEVRRHGRIPPLLFIYRYKRRGRVLPHLEVARARQGDGMSTRYDVEVPSLGGVVNGRARAKAAPRRDFRAVVCGNPALQVVKASEQAIEQVARLSTRVSKRLNKW